MLEIGFAAFSCNKIEIVSLPNSIQKISMGAFKDCKHLREVNVRGVNTRQSSPTKIELCQWAFQGCDQLQTIVFYQSVAVLGARVFDDCLSLKQFLASISEVKKHAFSGCINLEELHFASDAILHDECLDESILTQISFVGSATFEGNVLDFIHKNKINIVCLKGSVLAELAYEGYQVKIV